MSSIWTQSKEYKLVKLLGKGGRGEVYKAYDQASDPDGLRPLSLKLLNSRNLDSKERCFFNQLEKWKFPNLASYYGLENFGDRLALVFEYIEGESLASYIDKCTNLEWGEFLYILNSVLVCLEDLKEKNMFHGDLKLENILIDSKAKVYLIDLNPMETELSLEYTNFKVFYEYGKGFSLDICALGFCIKRMLKKMNLDERQWQVYNDLCTQLENENLSYVFELIHKENMYAPSRLLTEIARDNVDIPTQKISAQSTTSYISMFSFLCVLAILFLPR